jgi:hypothetical protein
VVKPGGRIVLVTEANPDLGAGAELLRQSEDAPRALELLNQKRPADMAAAFQWAHAVQQASIYLLSGLPGETVEDLFAFPLDHADQAQRLLAQGQTCLVLPDAAKTLAVVRGAAESGR